MLSLTLQITINKKHRNLYKLRKILYRPHANSDFTCSVFFIFLLCLPFLLPLVLLLSFLLPLSFFFLSKATKFQSKQQNFNPAFRVLVLKITTVHSTSSTVHVPGSFVFCRLFLFLAHAQIQARAWHMPRAQPR